jgi:hypothetical protein
MKLLGNDEAQHAVAQEFQPLVGPFADAGMAECAAKQIGIAKAVPEARF